MWSGTGDGEDGGGLEEEMGLETWKDEGVLEKLLLCQDDGDDGKRLDEEGPFEPSSQDRNGDEYMGYTERDRTEFEQFHTFDIFLYW